MSDSLRDQLLGLGFKPASKPSPKSASKPQHDPRKRGRRDQPGPKRQGDGRGRPPREDDELDRFKRLIGDLDG